MILRPYQLDCVEGLRNNIRKSIRNQVLCAPTGSGKTVIGAYLIRECQEKGKRAVFVCDRISLINQTSEFFFRVGIDHGVIQGDHEMRRPGCRIQVASAQTLARRGWPAADLIINDECHALIKSTLAKIETREAVTIGLTATPFTLGLGKYYDAVVTVTTTNKLTEEGYLATFRTYAASEPDMSGAKVVAGEWQDDEVGRRAMPIIGDCVAEYLKHGEDAKFIAFGCTVAHCEEMQRQFLAKGVKTALYTYRTPDEERAGYMTEFRKPDPWMRGLISVSALSKGLDVEDLGCIILCRPLKSSLAEHIQILGRLLRPHPCKKEKGGLVLDHSGNMVRFWEQMEEFFEHSVHTLDDGKPKKKGEAKIIERKPVKCPKCAFVFKGGGNCPECGYIFPPKTTVEIAEGELREFNGASFDRMARRTFYGELRAIAFYRGYKPGWAAMKYKEFMGVWPNAYKDASMVEPSEDTRKRVADSVRKWKREQTMLNITHEKRN